jgi:hypothetical protein
MLPTKKTTPTYQTLDQIRLRKEELSSELQHDNDQFNSLWNQLFMPRKDSTKGEWVAGLIANSVTAIDSFLLVRKLLKNYGHLFGRKRRR